jgi:hypothetical protein
MVTPFDIFYIIEDIEGMSRALFRLGIARGERLPTLYSGGKALQLNSEVMEAVNEVGERLAAFVRHTWPDNDRCWRARSRTSGSLLAALTA